MPKTDNSSRSQIHIDYVELPVLDFDEAKDFYGGAFGWTFEDYGPEYVAFETGHLSGGFARVDDISPGGALVILFAEDLEAVCEQVKASGGEIVQEIFSFPGGRRFHFTDPSGNELAVWSDQ